MNILIFAHDCGLRGAERVVVDEAEALIARGWTVTVVVPCINGELSEFLRNKGINFLHIRYYSWIGPGSFKGRAFRTLMNVIAIPQMWRIIQSFQPDIIHVHSIACGIGAVAARLAGVPHVWHLHEPGPYARSADRPVFDLGERASVALARWTQSSFVAVSASVARLFEQQFRLSEVGVLYQSIDVDPKVADGDAIALRQITDWSGRKLVIVGALVLWKDQKTAVRAMVEIVKAWPGAGLFLIGDDQIGMGGEIDALARELGVADNVVRLGTMANAAPAIAAADGCIVTALDEGFGRVAVEAMMNETPVISADVDVNREVAGDGKVDFFSPSNPDAMAMAVSTLFSRPEPERQTRVLQAHAYARSLFGAEVTANALEAELLRCINATIRSRVDP